MKKSVFYFGFGTSLALLAVCAAYAFSPKWDDNFVLFFARDVGYAGSPAGFRYSYFLFLVLNLPAFVIGVPAIYLLDLVYVVTGKTRVVVVFVLLFLSSLTWWWAAARFAEWWSRRSQRGANSASS